MSSQKILFHALRYRLRDLPFNLTTNEKGIVISVDPSRNVTWKGKKFSFSNFPSLTACGADIQNDDLVAPTTLTVSKWKKFLDEIENFADLVARENLQDTKIWGSYPKPHATGFKEGTLPQSTTYLKEVYADKFIVPEKKGFVIDLRRSFRDYLISVDDEAKSFLDAASQIGSLGLGYNDPEKRGLVTHEENFEWAPKVFESEVYNAYIQLLRKLSGMPNVYFFNSGAEANEAAIQLCVRKNPKRKRILAFNGSFHGRTMLTIHLTHSPAKRLPFETYPEIVKFAPYPENKNPSENIDVSKDWILLWSNVKSPNFVKKIEETSSHADTLLKSEIESLLFVKDALEKQEFLATIIEPRQCEGGDRFASPHARGSRQTLRRTSPRSTAAPSSPGAAAPDPRPPPATRAPGPPSASAPARRSAPRTHRSPPGSAGAHPAGCAAA